MKKVIKLLLVSFIVIGSLTGCKAERVKVCSTIYPIKYLVDRIGGNRIESCYIGDNTQVTRAKIAPNYKTLVKGADVIYHAGAVEPFLYIYTNEFNLQKIDVYDAALNSYLYNFKRYSTVINNNKKIYIEGDYFENTDLFIDTDVYGIDPYVWLDPVAFTSMARTITDYLVEHAPLDKEYFLKNFEEVQNDLTKLDAEFNNIKIGKAPSFVSMTPSFGNWQKSYGVVVYPAILSKFGVVPNDKQIELIERRVKEAGIKYIAIEDGLSADQMAYYDKLVKDLKLKPYKLYNLSFITDDQIAAGLDYLSLMRMNYDALIAMTK